MGKRIPADGFGWTLKEFCEIPDQMGKKYDGSQYG